MRLINLIVVHCSAIRCGCSCAEHDLITNHLRRGFFGAGYHFYIRKNGDIETFRLIGQPGTYVKNHNAYSVGICYEGGPGERGYPVDTRTDFQKYSLRVFVMLLLRDYPGSRLCGHHDLSPDLDCNDEIEPEEWIKACPCFDTASILQDSVPPNPTYL